MERRRPGEVEPWRWSSGKGKRHLQVLRRDVADEGGLDFIWDPLRRRFWWDPVGEHSSRQPCPFVEGAASGVTRGNTSPAAVADHLIVDVQDVRVHVVRASGATAFHGEANCQVSPWQMHKLEGL